MIGSLAQASLKQFTGEMQYAIKRNNTEDFYLNE